MTLVFLLAGSPAAAMLAPMLSGYRTYPIKALAGLVAACFVAFAPQARAQLPSGGGAPGWDAALNRLFGDIKAFQAKAQIDALGSDNQPTMSLRNLGFDLLGERVRMDLDMAQVSGPQIPPSTLDELRKMGMDKLITVVLPDRRAVLFIYPALKAYVDKATPADEPSIKATDIKVSKTPLGSETIDGQACIKNKVVLSRPGGAPREAIVWEATGLKGFPVHIRIVENGKTLVIRFHDIQLKAPEAKRFEPPAGFARFDDFEKMGKMIVERVAANALKPATP